MKMKLCTDITQGKILHVYQSYSANRHSGEGNGRAPNFFQNLNVGFCSNTTVQKLFQLCRIMNCHEDNIWHRFGDL